MKKLLVLITVCTIGLAGVEAKALTSLHLTKANITASLKNADDEKALKKREKALKKRARDLRKKEQALKKDIYLDKKEQKLNKKEKQINKLEIDAQN